MTIKLNKKDKEEIIMHHREGESYRDIAKMFNVSHQAVKNVIDNQDNEDIQDDIQDDNEDDLIDTCDNNLPELIKQEKERLWDILSDLDDNTLKSAVTLVDNLAFLKVQLDELRAHINKNGVVETYQNGKNQFGTRESSEAKMYNSFLQRYIQTNAQLLSILPKAVATEVSDGFDEMLANKPR